MFASIRALHLELTKELSAVAFLQSIRKFCVRRGVPAVIMSDNAKTFKHSSKEVQVQDHLTNQQIEWQFIAEKARRVLGTNGTKCEMLFKENAVCCLR